MDLNLGFDTVCQAESGFGPGEAGCGGSDNSPGNAETGHRPLQTPTFGVEGGPLCFRMRLIRAITQTG